MVNTNTARKPKFRVLLMNLGYGTELDGSLWGYLTRWYRYLYTPQRIIREVRRSVYALLNRERPDLCCFVEIHHRHGFVPHPRAYASHIDNKYGRFSILRHLPFFRDNCNGFYSHRRLHFTKRYFKAGTKKLLYDIDVGNGFSLLLAHFSLRRDTRRRQFRELENIIGNRRNVILCGDFNIFRGIGELRRLSEDCGLQVVDAHRATFPTVHPRKTIDLFLCPKRLHSVSARVMEDVRVSDHLPVMLEVG